ncbi:Peptide methionine sulfoxide reductase [Hibiscus syriacus]|uniref:peptide-methionine (S)-S-oxide reductase n=1 Tax=Hibiscus syriacus TaxID=106335 RepID=A0A6A2X7I0_HIBSY|nr:Peptide methionine sulfoxide reductase [Hibiscus syriacus]
MTTSLLPGSSFAQFGAGCFWGVELEFRGFRCDQNGGRVPKGSWIVRVMRTCSGTTNHNEVGNDVGTQYRSGIYYYTPEQETTALESMEKHQKLLNRKIVTEILPAKKFYRAEKYHQQYLAKGGRFGFKQSAEKGCNDPIRCYG